MSYPHLVSFLAKPSLCVVWLVYELPRADVAKYQKLGISGQPKFIVV
jgi:hypothetical protein